MLMKYVGVLILGPFGWLAEYLPGPPDPLDVSIPYPDWLPSWPVTTALAVVLITAGFALLVRLARWLYGLAPVIQ